jgi:zinc transporter
LIRGKGNGIPNGQIPPVWARNPVLALPINIVAGLLGMNVGGIPLAQHPDGFLVVVAIIIVFTLFAAWYVFRQKK